MAIYIYNWSSSYWLDCWWQWWG